MLAGTVPKLTVAMLEAIAPSSLITRGLRALAPLRCGRRHRPCRRRALVARLEARGGEAAVRIVVLTAEVGEGHVAAARVLASELVAARADVEVVVCDSLSGLGRLLRWVLLDGYRYQLRFAPWVFGVLYGLVARVPVRRRLGRRRSRGRHRDLPAAAGGDGRLPDGQKRTAADTAGLPVRGRGERARARLHRADERAAGGRRRDRALHRRRDLPGGARSRLPDRRLRRSAGARTEDGAGDGLARPGRSGELADAAARRPPARARATVARPPPACARARRRRPHPCRRATPAPGSRPAAPPAAPGRRGGGGDAHPRRVAVPERRRLSLCCADPRSRADLARRDRAPAGRAPAACPRRTRRRPPLRPPAATRSGLVRLRRSARHEDTASNHGCRRRAAAG